MSVEIWTLAGIDREYEDLIAILRSALGAAEEAEIAHPETISDLRRWCNQEWDRLHPAEPVQRMTRLQEIQEGLKRSPFWPFWEALEKDQEVRWTGTKNATYFVVDPAPTSEPPEGYRGAPGMFIELRRHTGKTFWTHIGKVRPNE